MRSATPQSVRKGDGNVTSQRFSMLCQPAILIGVAVAGVLGAPVRRYGAGTQGCADT